MPVAPLAGGAAVILEHRFAHIPQDARRGRAWIAALAPLFAARLSPDAAVPVEAYQRYHHLAAVLLAAGSGPAQLLERSPEQARAQALHHLVLWTPLHGRARILAEGETASLGPGEILLLDLSRPVRIEMDAPAARMLVVPNRLVDETGEPSERHGRILSGRQGGLDGMVAAHLCRLGDCLPDLTAPEIAAVASATLTLCRVLLQRQAAGSTGSAAMHRDALMDREALGLAVRRCIEANLATVDGPMLMSRFGLSRTPLYRLFAANGGVYAYIRERRLAEAMRRLRQLPAGRRPELARLAHACGFHNQEVFGRAFRRRYGLNPSAVVPGRVVPAPVVPAADTPEPLLLAWLREL